MARTKKKEPAKAARPVRTTLDPLGRLYDAVDARHGTTTRTGKLLSAGIPKMAQKIVEEAAEVAIEAVRGQRLGVVFETTDLLYNLVVLLRSLDIPLEQIWTEMERREGLFGIAEKLPKALTPDDLG